MRFFARALDQGKPHLSDEHFTVDGTLIEAWASQKKDGGDADPGQFRGERRSNDTHASKTDPDARLYRKRHGQEACVGYLGHVLMENRHGMILGAMLTQADGTAERDAALLMLHNRSAVLWGHSAARTPVPQHSGRTDRASDDAPNRISTSS